MATTSSPFTRAVTSAMRKLYPEHLADKSFDNTGLLLEAPENKAANLKNSVLLTIDLTKAVAQEAIDKKCGVVVAYHPIIFRPLKALTFGNTQQSSLLRLAAEGISVYCPHTAVDAALGGNADWLADIVVARQVQGGQRRPTIEQNDERSGYGWHTFPRIGMGAIAWGQSLDKVHHKSVPIVPNSPGHRDILEWDSGMGRLITLKTPENALQILKRIAMNLGSPKSINVAAPQDRAFDEILVTRVAVCAGSGSSILGQADNADMLVTGEMSHHEVLAATENGKVVVSLGHSNSERQYLNDRMRPKLLDALKQENGPNFKDVAVEISEADRDPFVSFVRR